LNKCGRCNWATCYDDVLFFKTLIGKLAQNFCIDMDRIYAHGESNGAMMVQHLLRELPSAFAAVSSWFGTPLSGYLLGSRLQLVTEQLPLSRTAVLALHGRQDTTVPPQGGVQDQGWIYEPLSQSMGVWASLHHCSNQATALKTSWDGGPKDFRCAEYRKCATGRRIVRCFYNGVHGDWPTGHDGDKMTLWFLFQFDRSIPLARREVSVSADGEAERVDEKDAATRPKVVPEAVAEAAEEVAAQAKASQNALADLLNPQPTVAPVRPTTPEPTNPPVKITADELSSMFP
jgi:poly(3-hydroxybutyrate) depolymerase